MQKINCGILLRFLTKHSRNLGKSVRTLKLLCWLRIRGIRTVISRFVLYLSGEQNLSLTIYLVMRIFFYSRYPPSQHLLRKQKNSCWSTCILLWRARERNCYRAM